jgi:acylphosphatase
MNDKEYKRLHAQVTGRVQGVGFRYFVMGEAGNLRLTGWVRNRLDESVEVIAEGEKEKLVHLVNALNQGPRSSYVQEVKEFWSEPTGEFTGFSVRGTV